jgi:valyl-tRNA synthetase
MATNAASYNPVGEYTGSVSGKPPPFSNETEAGVASAANASATGSHVSRQDFKKNVKTEQQAKFNQNNAKGCCKYPGCHQQEQREKGQN